MSISYQVNGAKHEYQIVFIAENDDDLYAYFGKSYYGSTEGRVFVTTEQLTDASQECDTRVLTIYNDTIYEIVNTKAICRSHGCLIGGQVIAIGWEHDHNCQLLLGPEKYPFVDMTDWRCMKHQQFRPVLKVFCHSDNESILDMDRVYYHNKTRDTIFVTNDIFVNHEELLDEQINLLPTCTTSIDVNDNILVHVNYPNRDLTINGDLQFANKAGLLCDTMPVVNGVCTIPPQYIIGRPTADVLYGWNKIGSL